MDEPRAREFLERTMADLGADSGYEVRHEDFVMEMPQSGERTWSSRGRPRHQAPNFLARLYCD